MTSSNRPGTTDTRDDAALAPYRDYWRSRREAADAAAARRRERALEAAGSAALLLRERFGATRVLLFGSLARGRFHAASDIDLAVWGVNPELFFRAWNAVAAIAPEIEFDLVPGDDARHPVREEIEATGVALGG